MDQARHELRVNAISALARVRYGAVLEDPGCRRLMETIIRETVDMARASGVALSVEKLLEAAWRLGGAMPGAFIHCAGSFARQAHRRSTR